jgi:4'-phosphopantetheinyl transferase
VTSTLCTAQPSPPAIPSLRTGELHVISALVGSLVPLLEELERVLSPEERSQSRRFRYGRDRARFVVRRGFLRMIVGAYAGRPASDLRLNRGPSGKPSFDVFVGGEDFCFSGSHSHDLVLYSFARRRRIGIDVELIREVPDADEIVGRLFTVSERAEYRSLAERDRPRAFLRWWTCKEAYLKATGAGLGGGLDAVDVALTVDEPAWLRRIAGDPWEASRWSLVEFAPADGYVAALVADGTGLETRRWHVEDPRDWLGVTA